MGAITGDATELMTGFLSQSAMRNFEREANALRISLRSRATTAQLRSGEVPTVVFGARFARLWEPAEHKAYYGGRGSGKTHHLALYKVIRADNEHLTIACMRQFQNSIHDSSKKVIEHWIDQLGLSSRFKSTDQEIWSKHTDTLFRFKGLERNIDSVRSLEGVDICSVDEARSITQASMDVLMPTIRKAGSEIVSSWNPLDPTDPWDALYRNPKSRPPNSIVQRVGIEDNPFFYQTRMPSEMHRLKRQNQKAYEYIWLGEYDLDPESRVFHNTKIGVIDPNELEPFAPNYGLDLGFAADPTVITKTYVMEKFKTVYVQKEAFGYGVPNNRLGNLLLSVVDSSDDLIIGDSSEQRTIDYLQNEGFNVQPATKGPGSVKAGITWLQGYKIVINPSCSMLIDEARNYKWQTNRLTGAKLSAPVDDFNHAWDSIRYATEHLQLGGALDDDDTGMMIIPINAKGFGRARRIRDSR